MKVRQILVAGAAAVVMAGCAGAYGVEYGPGPVADVEYDGYYDGYYGPIYDGYWQNDVFFYRSRDNDRWHKGDARHFSREERPGFNHVHGTTHARPARDRDRQPG